MTSPNDSLNGAGTSAHRKLVNRVQQLRLSDQLGTSQKSGGGSWLPWILCGLLAMSWAGVGVRSYRLNAKPLDDQAAPSAGGKPLASNGSSPSSPPAAAGEILLQLKGNLIPALQILVSPRDVAAEVMTVNFCEGMLVKKGDLLATLLDTQYGNRYLTEEATVVSNEARLAKAKAALASADARVVKAKAVEVRAAQDLVQANLQLPTKTISDLEYRKFAADKAVADAETISARADVDAAKKEIEAAHAELRAAQARADEALRLQKNCRILSPIDGTVLTKKADVGSLVSTLAFNVSAGLCEIADLSKLEVEIDVPERQITKVRAEMDCQIAADADPNRIYYGRVDRVMPIADDSKSVIKVRVQVILPKGELPGSFLKPKMSVVATMYNRDFDKNAKR